jgi:hypothetical protein
MTATAPLPLRPMTRREAAEFLSCSEQTLANWARVPGRGPRFSRSADHGGKVWYRVADLVAYLESRAVPK